MYRRVVREPKEPGPTGQVGKRSATMMGAKVFTATKARDRDGLGEVLTRWIQDNPKVQIIDKVVTQSSDREFHCISITIFYETQP
jgi:hypothetical protein